MDSARYSLVSMKRDELRKLKREELLARAAALQIGRPAVLTHAELIDEIMKRVAPNETGMRGWLGRARDLVAQVVSKGLHLPDAAKLFRGDPTEPLPTPPPPLPTVTLAEIYAAQGHVAKAVSVLEQVLLRDPSHDVAQALKLAFEGRLSVPSPTPEALPKASEDAGPDATPAVRYLAPRQGETGAEASSDLATPTFRDELGVTVGGGARTQVNWALRPVRLARLQATAPSGSLVVRLVSMAACDHEPAAKTEDIAVRGVAGKVFTSALPSSTLLRSCLGWKTESTFVPLVVGPAGTVPLA